MYKYLMLFFIGTLINTSALFAAETEELYGTVRSLLGPIKEYDVKGSSSVRYRLYLNDKLLLESEYAMRDMALELKKLNGKSRISRAVYKQEVGARCPNRYHILDFSGTDPIVSNAFDNGRCSEFDWVSWGKRNTVIMLKDGSKFIYENGKVRSAK